MRTTHVTALIRSPAEPVQEGLFPIDTGATDSLLPRPQAIGIEPRGCRACEPAGGGEIVMDITVGEIEFMGETAGGTILFGAADADPWLGVTAPESVDIEVAPISQRLKRPPAARLKGFSAAAQ